MAAGAGAGSPGIWMLLPGGGELVGWLWWDLCCGGDVEGVFGRWVGGHGGRGGFRRGIVSRSRDCVSGLGSTAADVEGFSKAGRLLGDGRTCSSVTTIARRRASTSEEQEEVMWTVTNRPTAMRIRGALACTRRSSHSAEKTAAPAHGVGRCTSVGQAVCLPPAVGAHQCAWAMSADVKARRTAVRLITIAKSSVRGVSRAATTARAHAVWVDTVVRERGLQRES